jgi:hypothetical protein
MSYSYKSIPGNPTADQLVEAGDKPDVNYLNFEFKRSLYTGNNVTRVDNNDAVRYCKWSGQTDDGKKWSSTRPDGEQVFPFEGASDVRVRLVDSTINEIVATLTTAFERGSLTVSGVDVGDAAAASTATELMTWIRENKLKADLQREAELLAQYGQQYGWGVAHVCWDQKVATRTQSISAQEVISLAQQAAAQNPGSVLAELPSLIANPESEQQAADIVTTLLPDMTIRDARAFVKGLREEGRGEYEEEYVQRNLPIITALKPFDEVSFPPETIDLQRARVIFRREYFTEVELRAMVNNAGWDPEFVEKAAVTQGRQSWYNNPNLVTTSLNVTGTVRNDHLIEIVHCYSRSLSPKGAPAIYYTVLCPQLDDSLYGKYELLDYAHGEYPFVEYRRERVRRAICESRGIPELAMTDQEEIKAQHDSIRDRTAFSTLPPIKVKKRIGMVNKIGPAVQLPVTQSDDYQFMDPPRSNIQEAMVVIQQVESRHANYFGLQHSAVPPAKAASIMQKEVNNWFGTWSRIFSQTFQLCLQYLPEEQILRITGGSLPRNISEIAGQFDFVLKFDVREMNDDYVMKKLQAISQFVIPLDAGGVIDRNKLIQAITAAISPDAARDMVVDQAGASQQMFKQVQSDVGMMMLGNEALYVENDPAAQTKLGYVQQVMQSNPKAQAAAQQDQNFQQLLQKYVQNLQFSVQQQQNKQVGRIGVEPMQQQPAA